MKHESLKTAQQDLEPEVMEYDGGKLAYLHFNQEQANPDNNKLIVIPGFTQGVEVMEGFGEALGDDGQREVFVLDQPQRDKKTFDRKGELGLGQQVEAFMAFIEQKHLTHVPIDFVANSFATSIVAEAAIEARKRGWTCFDSEEGSNAFFIASSGSNPDENVRSLGKRWVGWMAKNAASDKVLDPTREMLKAGQQNFIGDIPKTINEALALAKHKIDYAELEKAGVKPLTIGYADDHLMPFQETTAREGAVSLIDNASNAPTLPNGEPYPGAGSFDEFKEKTGLKGKDAKKAWVHHYRAAEHNDMQFHANRSARFIIDVLARKERQK
jgi:hypothetical protein